MNKALIRALTQVFLILSIQFLTSCISNKKHYPDSTIFENAHSSKKLKRIDPKDTVVLYGLCYERDSADPFTGIITTTSLHKKYALMEKLGVPDSSFCKEITEKVQTERYYIKGRLYEKAKKRWHENDKLKFQKYYRKGKLHGMIKEWDQYGELSLKAVYKNGFRNGEYVQYRYVEKSVGTFINGTGTIKTISVDGELLATKSYKNDLENGEFKTWYENGQLLEKGHFHNGKLNGQIKVWHENGVLHLESNWMNDVRHGSQKEWDIDGNLISEACFLNGKKCAKKPHNH